MALPWVVLLVVAVHGLPTAWRMNGGSEYGNGQSSYVQTSRNRAMQWHVAGIVPPRTNLPDHERPSPVIDDADTSYFANTTGFSSILSHGVLQWHAPCPATYFAVSSPALSSNLQQIVAVCTSPSSSIVVALQASTGLLLWKWITDTMILAAPMIDTTLSVPVVLLAGENGVVTALRVQDGSSAWATTVKLDGPIRSTPCLERTTNLWYVFTTVGSVSAIAASSGTVVTTASITQGRPGFSGACASVDGLVAVGAHDYNFYVLAVQPGVIRVQCTAPTLNRITQGVAVANGTFLVPSTDNSLRAYLPNAGVCLTLFQIRNLPDPSRPCFDGMSLAVVGHGGGLVALDVSWFGNTVWNMSTTGESFMAPALGPRGTVYVASSSSSGLFSVGITEGFVQTLTRASVMTLGATPRDPKATAQLRFLCEGLGLAATRVGTRVAALAEACSVYNLTISGLDPSGFPPNYVDWETPQQVVAQLQQLNNLLKDTTMDVAQLTKTDASLAQQLAQVDQVLLSYTRRKQQQQQQLQQVDSMLISLGLVIIGTMTHLVLYGVALQLAIEAYAEAWLVKAVNFAQAAMREDEAAAKAYASAINSLHAAIHSSFWDVLSGKTKKRIADAMNQLEAALQHVLAAGLNWVQAGFWWTEFTNMVAISTFFSNAAFLNLLLMQNNTLPEFIPIAFAQFINLASVQRWLGEAQRTISLTPEGALIADQLNAYIANTEALVAADLAYFGLWSQHTALQTQIVVGDQEIASVQNSRAAEATQRASVGAALRVALAHQYSAQILALRLASRACGQFAYWTLTDCTLPMPANPMPQDIDLFAVTYTQALIDHTPQPQRDAWVQVSFDRSSSPEVFSQIEKGSFSFDLVMPNATDDTLRNVRTLDYRAFFLPQNAQDDTLDQIRTKFKHEGMSRIMDKHGRVFEFAHAVFEDSSAFTPNTPGCGAGSHQCHAPQCAEFDLSPYGAWTIQVNHQVFLNTSVVKSLVVQFHLLLDDPASDEPPLRPVIFANGNQRFVLPCTGPQQLNCVCK